MTHDVTGVQKTRKNVRENFTYSMMLGVEEAREKDELGKIKGLANDGDEQSEEYCNKIATQIESGMFALYGQEIVSFFELNSNRPRAMGTSTANSKQV